MNEQLPPATLILATRDRATDVERALASVADLRYPALSVLVVDQSTLPASGPRPSAAGPHRLTWWSQSTTGKSRALNLALLQPGDDVLLFTDDDCTVPPDWAKRMVSALMESPETGLVFSRVEPGEHDATSVFIPDFLPARPRTWRRPWSGRRFAGLGASMAARRAALLSAGGFDERLGPGSHFGNSEDTDMAYRVMRRGYRVVHTPATFVTHYGGRPYASGAAREIVVRSYYSFGAMCGRAAGRGDLLALAPLAVDMADSSWSIVRGLATGRRPLGARRLPALTKGFFAGLRDGSPRQSSETAVTPAPAQGAATSPATTWRI